MQSLHTSRVVSTVSEGYERVAWCCHVQEALEGDVFVIQDVHRFEVIFHFLPEELPATQLSWSNHLRYPKRDHQPT